MPVYRALYELWTALGGRPLSLARLCLAIYGVTALGLVVMPGVDGVSRAECGIFAVALALYLPMVRTEATLRLYARRYAALPLVPPLVTVMLIGVVVDIVRSAARIGPPVPASFGISDLSTFMFGWFLAVLVLLGRSRRRPRRRELPEALRRRFARFTPQPVPSR